MPQPVYGNIDLKSVNDLINIVSSGDLSGSRLSQLAVTAIRGSKISSTAPTTSNQALVWDQTNLQWSPSAVVTFIGIAGGLTVNANQGNVTVTLPAIAGDVTGAYGSVAVTGIRQIIVDPSAAWNTNGFLNYNGTKLGVSAAAGDVTGTINALAVTKMRGTGIATTTPSTGQVLRFDGTNWAPSGVDSVSTVTMADDVTGISNASVVTALRGQTLPTAFTASGYLYYSGTALSWKKPHYQFDQTTASGIWNVTHNLAGVTPMFAVYTQSTTAATWENIWPGGVSAIDSNTVQMTFSPSVSGKAIFFYP